MLSRLKGVSFGWEEIKNYLLRDYNIEKATEPSINLILKFIIKNKESLRKNSEKLPKFSCIFNFLLLMDIYQEAENVSEDLLGTYEEALSILLSELINILFISSSDQMYPYKVKATDVIGDLCLKSDKELLMINNISEHKEMQDILKFEINHTNFDHKKIFVGLNGDECKMVEPKLSNNPLDIINQTINQIEQPADEISISGEGNKSKILLKKLSLICIDNLKQKIKSEIDGLQSLAISLPFLSKYEVQDGFKKLLIPNNLTEASTMAQSCDFLLHDIHVLWRLFSLPIFEPLSRTRVEILVSIATSCLHAAVVCAASASLLHNPLGSVVSPLTKTSSTGKDSIAIVFKKIVQESIDIFNSLLRCLKNSISTNGFIVENIYWVGCTMLLSGLQSVAEMNEISLRTIDKQNKNIDKTKTSMLGRSSSKHGFGEINVILAKEAFNWLSDISSGEDMAANQQDLMIKSFDLYEEHTFGQLIASLVEIIDLPSFAFYLVKLSVHKGISLIKSSKQAEETKSSNKENEKPSEDQAGKVEKEETLEIEVKKKYKSVKKREFLGRYDSDAEEYGSEFENSYEGDLLQENDDDDEDDDDEDEDDSSESTAFYDEDVSASQDDDDSDSDLKNLKKLFEVENESEVGLGGVSSSVPTNKNKARRKSSTDATHVTLDPKQFVILATNILKFLTKTFLNSNNLEIKKYFSGNALNGDHMKELAAVIKELDDALPLLNNNTTVKDFSIYLTKFIYTMVSKNCLTNFMQDKLLLALGMDISNLDQHTYSVTTNSSISSLWPLHISPRCLNVLLHVVVAKNSSPTTTMDFSSYDGYDSIISIWNSFLHSIQISFENPNAFSKMGTNIDVNVEHMQLLIVLFYMLPHPLKRNIWIQLNLKLIHISNNIKERNQIVNILPLARLLLLVDYFLQNFYEMPKLIADQMMHNVHSVLVGVNDTEISFHQYTYFSKIENVYTADMGITNDNSQIKFYNIIDKEKSCQEIPKIDGLALSALLSLGSGFDYDFYYENLIKVLLPLAMPQIHNEATSQTHDGVPHPIHNISCHYYYTTIIFGILDTLPPSVKFLKQFEQPVDNCCPLQILHLLKFDAKCHSTIFTTWIQETLLKMGLSVKDANKLVNNRKEAQSVELSHQALKSILKRLMKNESSLDVGEINMEVLVCLEAVITIIYIYHLTNVKSIDEEVVLHISKMINLISNSYGRPYLMRTMCEEKYVSSAKLLSLNSKVASITSPNVPVLNALAKSLSPHLPFSESLRTVLNSYPAKKPIEGAVVGDIVNFVDEILESNIPSSSPYSLVPQLVPLLNISSSCLQSMMQNWSIKDSNVFSDMFEVSCDSSMAFIYPQISSILNMFNSVNDDEQMTAAYLIFALKKIVEIIKETKKKKVPTATLR